MKQTCPSSDFVKLVMKKHNQECKSRKCCIWWLQVFIEDTHRATKRGELRESSVGLVVALLEHKEQAQLVHDKENTDKSSTTTDCNCSRNIITPPPPPLCALDICCYGLRSHSGWVQSQACVLQHGCIFHSNHFNLGKL